MDTDINRMFRAFSDPTRLRILHLLSEGELCVGDLVTILDVPQPTASRHLRYLKDAKLAQCRKVGRWCVYSLTEAQSGFHKKLLSCLGSCFAEVPELHADSLTLQRLKKSGGCCAPI